MRDHDSDVKRGLGHELSALDAFDPGQVRVVNHQLAGVTTVPRGASPLDRLPEPGADPLTSPCALEISSSTEDLLACYASVAKRSGIALAELVNGLARPVVRVRSRRAWRIADLRDQRYPILYRVPLALDLLRSGRSGPAEWRLLRLLARALEVDAVELPVGDALRGRDLIVFDHAVDDLSIEVEHESLAELLPPYPEDASRSLYAFSWISSALRRFGQQRP